MKKRSKAYWEKRATDRMVDYMADAERTSNTLGKAYYSVGRYLSDEAAKILKSFTDTFGLSESEARRLIGNTPDRSITEKLKKALPKIADKDKRRQAEAMISSPAYSYRIKRLENLGNNVRKQCSQLYNTEVLADDSFFRGLCDDAYKHCIFDMQKGMGVSSAFDIMPTSRINRILGAKWSGEHFSARVWGNTNALADGLQNDMLVGIMSGKSEKKMAEDIMNRCAVGVFEARRLVRTEACYIANQAELDGYKQTGIESYEFSAVLDNRTSKLCDNVDGLDGKIFKISEAVPGKNLPPMHPFCRSTTLPILPSEEELDREIAELSDEIGADVDFEEWKENLQETEDGRLVYRTKAVDKSGESGIIKASKSTDYTPKNHYFIDNGSIDVNDDAVIVKEIFDFIKENRDSQIEKCLVITKKGRKVTVYGDRYTVDTTLLGNDMKGSINIHNHVTGESQYSFSWEDLKSSFYDGSDISLAFDEKYRYTMSFDNANKDMDVYEAYQEAKLEVDEILCFEPETIPIGDEQHERIKRACQKLGVRYGRKKIS